jgi:hypothetical protein
MFIDDEHTDEFNPFDQYDLNSPLPRFESMSEIDMKKEVEGNNSLHHLPLDDQPMIQPEDVPHAMGRQDASTQTVIIGSSFILATGVCTDCQFHASAVRTYQDLLAKRTKSSIFLECRETPIFAYSEVGEDPENVCSIHCVMNHVAHPEDNERLQNKFCRTRSCIGNALAYCLTYQREEMYNVPSFNMINLDFENITRETIQKIDRKREHFTYRTRMGKTGPTETAKSTYFSIRFPSGNRFR